jgi:ParB-like chromosome segregation protein Spo0J
VAYNESGAILMAMKVHPFADAFPMMTDEEMDRLVDDIRTHGQVQPCLMNEDRVLLDGRNRLAACERLGVEPTFQVVTPESETAFIASLNVARRNLTASQLAVIALESLPHFEAEARERQVAAGQECGKGQLVAPVPQAMRKPLARDRAAAAVGISGRTLAQAKRVAEQAPELVDEVKAGNLTLKVAEREIRKREQVAREIAQRAAAQVVVDEGARFDLRQGDFRTVLADLDDGSVDLILTDPPYGNDAINLYRDLGAFAARVLRPGGSLITYVGQATLTECSNALGEHLRYWWTLALLHESGLQQLPGKWVQVRWKPLLWFVRDDRGGSRRYVDDVVHGSKPRKDLHEWAQGIDEVRPIIKQLTEPGALIVDPFAGSASFGHAANALGRHFIGCDDGSHSQGHLA